MDDACTVLVVAEKKGKQARITELGAKQPSYAQYLEQLCTARERKHLHWPRVCDQNEGGSEPGVYLRCIKCGFKVHNSQRYRLLRGRCDDFTQQLTSALISPERSMDAGDQSGIGMVNPAPCSSRVSIKVSMEKQAKTEQNGCFAPKWHHKH